MAQGYLHSVTFNGTEISFKSITYAERPTSINIAQRRASDGSVNQGFNMNQGDLRQLVWTCEELIDDDDNEGNLSLLGDFDAGDTFTDQQWEILYNGVVIYSGTGFYVADIDGRASIPGEGAFRITFESIDTGFQKFGEDLPDPDGTP